MLVCSWHTLQPHHDLHFPLQHLATTVIQNTLTRHYNICTCICMLSSLLLLFEAVGCSLLFFNLALNIVPTYLYCMAWVVGHMLLRSYRANLIALQASLCVISLLNRAAGSLLRASLRSWTPHFKWSSSEISEGKCTCEPDFVAQSWTFDIINTKQALNHFVCTDTEHIALY